MSRQFLERMAIIEGPGGILEALYHGAAGVESFPAVIVPSHPAHYGTMDIALMAELAWSLSQKGLSTLRFNFRGVGASTSHQDLNWEDLDALMPTLEEDLQSAIERQLENHQHKKVHLVGYGLGAVAALRVALKYAELVQRLVLVCVCVFPHIIRQAIQVIRIHALLFGRCYFCLIVRLASILRHKSNNGINIWLNAIELNFFDTTLFTTAKHHLGLVIHIVASIERLAFTYVVILGF